MKTKEEIEQLAEKYYSQITLSQRTAFKFGYTQCQEDNKSISKKLKLIEASINGSLDGIEFDNNSDVIEKSFVVDMLNDLKKLLNKQD
jgi:hypothetical protein